MFWTHSKYPREFQINNRKGKTKCYPVLNCCHFLFPKKELVPIKGDPSSSGWLQSTLWCWWSKGLGGPWTNSLSLAGHQALFSLQRMLTEQRTLFKCPLQGYCRARQRKHTKMWRTAVHFEAVTGNRTGRRLYAWLLWVWGLKKGCPS